MKLGKCKEATDTFKRSLAKFPTTNKEKIEKLMTESKQCAASLVHADKLIVRKSYSEAIPIIDKVLDTCPNADSLRVTLSRLLLETHQWERLIQTCSVVLRSHSDDSEALYMRGWAFLMSGDVATAQTHFKKVGKAKRLDGSVCEETRTTRSARREARWRVRSLATSVVWRTVRATRRNAWRRRRRCWR